LIRQVWQTNGIEIRLSDAKVFADLKKGHLSFREVMKLLANLKQGTEIVERDIRMPWTKTMGFKLPTIGFSQSGLAIQTNSDTCVQGALKFRQTNFE
jgi:hypothetical protein